MCDHSTVQAVPREHLEDDTPDLMQCTACGQTFVAYEDYVKQAALMDGVAATASAMLWDFHERAVEKYGKPVADAVTPSGYEFTPDIEHEHEWNLGKCERCGASMFVGDN